MEIRPAPRAGGKTTGQMLAAEAERIGRAVPRGCLRVALDERAREFTTAELARWRAAQREGGRDIAFLIGGADGLAPEAKRGAERVLRFSPRTPPPHLPRVLLAEQLQ